MKIVTALFALLFSAQVAADCSTIEFEAPRPGVAEGAASASSDTARADKGAAERRQAYLDCLKPEPFVPERIDVRLEDIADDFDGVAERFAARSKVVAVN